MTKCVKWQIFNIRTSECGINLWCKSCPKIYGELNICDDRLVLSDYYLLLSYSSILHVKIAQICTKDKNIGQDLTLCTKTLKKECACFYFLFAVA